MRFQNRDWAVSLHFVTLVDEFIIKIAEDLDEAHKLIEVDFEYAREIHKERSVKILLMG